MTNDEIIINLDLKRVRGWASIVNGCLVAIRSPEVLEQMGFPPEFVRSQRQLGVIVSDQGRSSGLSGRRGGTSRNHDRGHVSAHAVGGPPNITDKQYQLARAAAWSPATTGPPSLVV